MLAEEKRGGHMKYFVLVTDGAADEKIKELDGRTPLEAAHMPCADSLARKGETGFVRTVPAGISPGSDAANLSVMGYDPSVYLTGRSPLEAVSIGIEMLPGDVAFRTNIITLKGEGDYEDLIVEDHSSGDISTEEADQLIRAVNEAFADENMRFYTGVSYRHCLIVHNGTTAMKCTPPHDILGRRVGDYLPEGEGSGILTEMMKKSYEILRNHPVNIARREKGLNTADTIWIWGQGTKPSLPDFMGKYGLDGAAISAVDLIKGIAIAAGMESIDVEGATGTLHTNYEGKKDAAIDAFERGRDFVYMHLEGPDECSHQGDMEGKIKSLEDIDEKILQPVVEYLREKEEPFSVMILPDHPTPLSIRTHTSDPVPYVIYRSDEEKPDDIEKKYSEASAGKTGNGVFEDGHKLADWFFLKK